MRKRRASARSKRCPSSHSARATERAAASRSTPRRTSSATSRASPTAFVLPSTIQPREQAVVEVALGACTTRRSRGSSASSKPRRSSRPHSWASVRRRAASIRSAASRGFYSLFSRRRQRHGRRRSCETAAFSDSRIFSSLISPARSDAPRDTPSRSRGLDRSERRRRCTTTRSCRRCCARAPRRGSSPSSRSRGRR